MKHGDEKGRRVENGRAAMVLCCRVTRGAVSAAVLRGMGVGSFWLGTSWQKVLWLPAFGGEKLGREDDDGISDGRRGETIERKAAAQRQRWTDLVAGVCLRGRGGLGGWTGSAARGRCIHDTSYVRYCSLCSFWK